MNGRFSIRGLKLISIFEMDNLECFVNYVKATVKIARIAHIVSEVYEVYKANEANESVETDVDEVPEQYSVASKKLKLTREPEIISITKKEKVDVQIWKKLLKEKNENYFYKAIRMSVGNFKILLSQLKKNLLRHLPRKLIDPETRLIITLLYLAQGCRIEIIAWGFQLDISTVHKAIYDTCDAIWNQLSKVYLSTPRSIEGETLSYEFYTKIGMPNCIGALDGKHINITERRDNGHYEKLCSVVLLAACDANYNFTYADCVVLRSQNDSDALSRCDFITKLLNGTLEVLSNNNLPGTSNAFQYYFATGSSFPLKKHVMRPYPGNNLTQDKENFNLILSKAQLHIENSFGILANRWRILTTEIQTCPEKANRIVLATVLLHNFLMQQADRNYFIQNLIDQTKNNKDIPGKWRDDIEPLKSYQPRSSNRSSTKAIESRDILKDFLQAEHS